MNLSQRWRTSLLFRRIVTASAFVLAAVLIYVASNIRRSVPLPDPALNARAIARIGDEHIVLRKPIIAPGDLVLSYVGSANEVADLWLHSAILAPQSQMLFSPGSGTPAPSTIGYTTANLPSPPKPGDTCHTTIEIRRAADSAPIQALTLYQTDLTAGAQRFRQVVVDAGDATLNVEVHTDPPTQDAMDLAGCHKNLTVASNPSINLPPIPVRMVVHGGFIDLHFNPANPAVSIFTGKDQTFEAVSLGDNSLRAADLQIVAAQVSGAPRLEVRPAHGTQAITISRLRLGSDFLTFDVGSDGENALADAGGSSIYNYDLIDAIQKNPLISSAFAAILAPALWAWVKKTCFPRKRKQPSP